MSDFYLASHSARRVELLRQVGARFETLLLRAAHPRGPDVDEQQHEGEAPMDYALRTAREKSAQGMQMLYARSLLRKPVLGADTVVVVDDTILGKPKDAAEAGRFLAQLSGRSHDVYTAVALALPGMGALAPWTLLSRSVVTLRAIDPGEIARYLATGEPFDKAGAYAIQGRAAVFVDRIEGSYSGVVGLPLAETATLLARAGVRLL
jgi:septum formation protein